MSAGSFRRDQLLLVAAVVGFIGCYPHGKPPANVVDQVVAAEDRVGIDDTFDVRVYGEPELSGMFRVATDGTVDYPLAGRLQVAGIRTGDIQRLIVDKLKDRYLKDPQVIVTIKDRNSQKISVLG
ncbi:MAG TPA: polysaccharide biosynthesis/export family protein, partial [Acidothermaceae bacterium]